MASVFHVARYVVERIERITSMKLQKLVFYCQAYNLAWYDVPLFDEDFQAWANGPVCPELFEKHKGMFRLNNDFLKEYSGFGFSDEDKDTMDSIIEHYGDKTPEWLSQLTHMEAPWRIARGSTPIGDSCTTIITKDSMQAYYGGLARGEE